jgi:hypothetical protein
MMVSGQKPNGDVTPQRINVADGYGTTKVAVTDHTIT